MAVGVDIILQVLFLVNTGKSVVPFFRHCFTVLPALFTLLSLAVHLLLVVWVFFLAGDRTVQVFQVTSRAAFLRMNLTNTSDVSGMASHVFPVPYELFCRFVMTQTTIYAAALFCCVAWLCAGLERARRLYVWPMLLDIKLIEASLWAGYDDWTALDIVEQEKHV